MNKPALHERLAIAREKELVALQMLTAMGRDDIIALLPDPGLLADIVMVMQALTKPERLSHDIPKKRDG